MNEGNQSLPSAPKPLQPVGEPGFASRAQLNKVIRGQNELGQSLQGVQRSGEPDGQKVPQPNVKYKLASRTALGVYRARLIEKTKNNQSGDLTAEALGTPRDDARLIVWSFEEKRAGYKLFKTDEDDYIDGGDVGMGISTYQQDETTKYPIIVAVGGGNQIKYGTVTGGDWTSGATMTLSPSTADGVSISGDSVTVYVKKDQSSYTMANSTNVPSDTVVPYVVGSNGDLYVFGADPTTGMSDFQINGSGTDYKFQKKTRDTWGTIRGTESDWVDIITGGACT